MTRLLLRLLGIKDFEVCQSCETLKQQLGFANEEKKQLTETLLSIIKPKTYESAPQELMPIANSTSLFSRRRAVLESKDREEARILKQAQYLGKPDDNFLKNNEIEKLETELDISGTTGE